jgi:excisionase family DNA binding protein
MLRAAHTIHDMKHVPTYDDPPEAPIREEIRALIDGLREEVKALREDVKALRRSKAPDGPDALLTRNEAAERLGVSQRTLDDLEASGDIQAIRIRGRVLYAPATLSAFIDRCARGGRS